jgi:hypothetical protein
MEDEQKGEVLVWAVRLMNEAVRGIKQYGQRGGYWQAFDAEPDDFDVDAEVAHEQLQPEEAKAVIGERIRAGFQGIAGLACLRQESDKWVIRVEAFDTRDNRSVSFTTPIKRSFTGKFSPASTNIDIDDIPEIPGVFSRRA